MCGMPSDMKFIGIFIYSYLQWLMLYYSLSVITSFNVCELSLGLGSFLGCLIYFLLVGLFGFIF